MATRGLASEDLDKTKPLHEQVLDLAISCSNVADADGNPPLELLASTLSQLSNEIGLNYVPLRQPDGSHSAPPTIAQMWTLARLVRDFKARGASFYMESGTNFLMFALYEKGELNGAIEPDGRAHT